MNAFNSIKSTLTKLATTTALVGGLVLGASQAEAGPIYTFDTTTGSGSGTNELTFTATGFPSVLLKARAFWTSSGTGSSTFSNSGATLTIYGSNGFGLNNGSSDSSSPQHAVDNNGRKDFVLFEFSSNTFDPESFKIGYKDTDADIQFWLGNSNTAGLNLATACSGACSISGLAALGFTALTSFSNVPTNTAQNFNTSLTGRYLLVAGNLSDSNDYFKISQVVAATVPEPASFALFGFGLAGLAGAGALARRRAVRA